MDLENGKRTPKLLSQIHMKASTSMIRNAVREHTHGHREMSTLAILKMMRGTARERWSGQMARFTLVIGFEVSNMDGEHFHIQAEKRLKESSRTTSIKETHI